MIASEDENDTDDAQGSSVASSLPSQTQPTAVLAEEDTEEDLKDECAWYGHSEWLEAAKSNEAKKKGARRTRLQRIKKRCEDAARLRREEGEGHGTPEGNAWPPKVRWYAAGPGGPARRRRVTGYLVTP